MIVDENQGLFGHVMDLTGQLKREQDLLSKDRGIS